MIDVDDFEDARTDSTAEMGRSWLRLAQAPAQQRLQEAIDF